MTSGHVTSQKKCSEAPHHVSKGCNGRIGSWNQSRGYTQDPSQNNFSQSPYTNQFSPASRNASTSQPEYGALEKMQYAQFHQYMTSNNYANVTSSSYANVTSNSYANVTTNNYAYVTSNNYANVTSNSYANVTSNNYANGRQSEFQQLHHATRYMRGVPASQAYSTSSNERQMELTRQQNSNAPGYSEGRHNSQGPNVQCQATSANVQGTARSESRQNSNMHGAPPPYAVHINSQITLNVQNQWPSKSDPSSPPQLAPNHYLYRQVEAPLPRDGSSQQPANGQQQPHVQLPIEVLKLLHPQQVYRHTNEHNLQNVLSDTQSTCFIGPQRPQNTTVETDYPNVNDYTKSAIGNAQPSLCNGSFQVVPNYRQEFTTYVAPACTPYNVGNIPDSASSKVPECVTELLDTSPNLLLLPMVTGNVKITKEQMVQLREKLVGMSGAFLDALLYFNEKYKVFKSSSCNTNLPNSNVQRSTLAQNVNKNAPQAIIWPVHPDMASNAEGSAVSVSAGIAYQQHLLTQRRATQEANCIHPPSVPHTGQHDLDNSHPGSKSSPQLTTLACQRARNRDELNSSAPFSDYLRNTYLSSEEKNKAVVGYAQEGFDQTKACSALTKDIKSEPINEETESTATLIGYHPMNDQCALADVQSADATKLQSNVEESWETALSVVQDWHGNATRKQLSNGMSLGFQCHETKQNPVDLPSSDLASTSCNFDYNEIVPQVVLWKHASPRTEKRIKQAVSDVKQNIFSSVDLQKVTSSNNHSQSKPPSRKADWVCENSKTSKCLARSATVYTPDPLGFIITKSADPQFAVGNPKSPSKYQGTIPPRKEVCIASKGAAHGRLLQPIKDKWPGDINSLTNVDYLSNIDDQLEKLDSDLALRCDDSRNEFIVAGSANCRIPSQRKSNKSLSMKNPTTPPIPLENAKLSQPKITIPNELSMPEGELIEDYGYDQQLMITSVCSLAEGTTFYDSQIAQVFESDCQMQSQDSRTLLQELVVPQSKTETGTKGNVCETETLPEAQRFDESHTQFQSLPVDTISVSNNKRIPIEIFNNAYNNNPLAAMSKPDQARAQTHFGSLNVNIDTAVTYKRTSGVEHSLNPVNTPSEVDNSVSNEKERAGQGPDMTDCLLEERACAEGSSQLSDLLRMFPFGIDRMESTDMLLESHIVPHKELYQREGTIISPKVDNLEKEGSKKKQKDTCEFTDDQMVPQYEKNFTLSSPDIYSTVQEHPTNNRIHKCLLVEQSQFNPLNTSSEEPLKRDGFLTCTHPKTIQKYSNDGLPILKTKGSKGPVIGPTRKNKKFRLIVKTDFLKSKHSTKPCLASRNESKSLVSENDNRPCMISSDASLRNSEKKPGSEGTIRMSDFVSFLKKEIGQVENQSVKETTCAGKESGPRGRGETVNSTKMGSAHEFFQRRKAEQIKLGTKMQNQAKQPVQYTKPCPPFETLKKSRGMENDLCLEQNIPQHPKASDMATSCKTTPGSHKGALQNTCNVNTDVNERTDGFSEKECESNPGIDHKVSPSGRSTPSASTGFIGKRKSYDIAEETIAKCRMAKATTKGPQITPLASSFPQYAAEWKSYMVSEPLVLQHGTERPKMLEFKLCPEELLGCRLADDKSLRSRQLSGKENSLFEGNIVQPKSSTLKQIMSTTEKTASRSPTSNSKSIFNAYKKLYLEIKRLE
ncbi:retroelement silencing factor 1-like isoform X2 [Ambystoma mexicanum]|uniref:retroelement silencing factor 1-like isoform X2 n=1 Tax=Ambystoma mexicanum TaxID=8296 RepID=UPI0037E7A82F